MKYMLLLHAEERTDMDPSSDEFGQMLAAFEAFNTELRDRGKAWEGYPLQATDTATSVRVRNGDQLVTDGPFAEIKEQLGGYYVLDARDLDEATEIAALIPTAQFGTVEIRPVMEGVG